MDVILLTMKDQPLPPSLAFQCPKRWEEMRAAGSQRRFCESCQLHVHDLSAMTRGEGAAFLARANGRCCVSFERRADGSMVTRTRWSGLERRWRQVRRGVFALLALVAPFSFTACGNPDRYRLGGDTCVTGGGDGKDRPAPATNKDTVSPTPDKVRAPR